MGFTLRTVERICVALDIDLRITGRWRGGELDRLLDAGHAALQDHVKRLLEQVGWLVRVEVTFSRYGERGSIDLLAFHPPSGILLVVEIKTVIADVQSLLRPLDIKARLAHTAAATFGWRPRAVVPCLVIAEESTSRRRVARHSALFGRFTLRGLAARSWLRAPTVGPEGVLVFAAASPRTGKDARKAGRQRVRQTRARRDRPATALGDGSTS